MLSWDTFIKLLELTFCIKSCRPDLGCVSSLNKRKHFSLHKETTTGNSNTQDLYDKTQLFHENGELSWVNLSVLPFHLKIILIFCFERVCLAQLVRYLPSDHKVPSLTPRKFQYMAATFIFSFSNLASFLPWYVNE